MIPFSKLTFTFRSELKRLGCVTAPSQYCRLQYYCAFTLQSQQGFTCACNVFHVTNRERDNGLVNVTGAQGHVYSDLNWYNYI